MDKKNPTVVQMMVVLMVIAIVCSAGVAAVHSVTEDPIAASRAAKLQKSLSVVLPEFDNDPSKDTLTIKIDENSSAFCYLAKKGDQVVGYAIKAGNKDAYNGLIEILVGLDKDGKVQGTSPVTLAETPGLGQKAANPDDPFVKQFVGLDPSQKKLSVKKDGGDIDAISAATITSRAFTKTVQTAYNAYLAYTGSNKPQAVSGATKPANTNADETALESDTAQVQQPADTINAK